MNGDEAAKLDDIHSDVRETRTKVEVVDERTAHMDKRMDAIQESVRANANDIDSLEDDVKRNTTILGGFIAGGSALMMWAADKVSRFV